MSVFHTLSHLGHPLQTHLDHCLEVWMARCLLSWTKCSCDGPTPPPCSSCWKKIDWNKIEWNIFLIFLCYIPFLAGLLVFLILHLGLTSMRVTAYYSYEELVAAAIWTLCYGPWQGISYRLCRFGWERKQNMSHGVLLFDYREIASNFGRFNHNTERGFKPGT